MKPNAKEIARASNGYTAVVRPNKKKGGWNVAMVQVETGESVFPVTCVSSKEEIGKAIASDLRMMDKCAFPVPMADHSRHRAYCATGKRS